MTNASLSEQVILITGASTGIGEALAQYLAAKFLGIRLVLAARNQEKLERVATQCRASGAEVLIVPTDLAQTEQVQALAKTALEQFGRVDALVNNAGYGQMGPVELITPEEAKQQFAVNFHGPLVLIQSLIPVMRSQGGGRIINISSLGGRMAFPAGGMYSSSKFALEALSDVLRMELEAFNIKVSVIEPGPVKTQFFDVATQKVELTTPDPTKMFYEPALRRVKNMEQQTGNMAWSSERVAKVIVRSLTDRRPRPRYIAATGGKILLFFMLKVFPTWVKDAFWKRFYGIDQVARDWRNRQVQELRTGE
ncbi:MAG: SDR family oxidoreductase [Kastovskya adunca ATA6-11-RM4]|jgi:short-subunit dehydrogenase|nr:SDR family oxidoreductase [Kastovskya adunca ATA6-11-RM4]